MVPGKKKTGQLARLPLLGPPTLKSIREETETTVWYRSCSEKAKSHPEINKRKTVVLPSTSHNIGEILKLLCAFLTLPLSVY